MYDFVITGAGIAGLAVAELLQRSGRSVLLLEAEQQLCRKASAEQQGWFHTGALYAALPSSRYFRQLVGNLDDLLNYYNTFPNMNLASGRILLAKSREGWFRNATCYYFYLSRGDPSIKGWQKPIWQLAILRAQMRLSWFETVDFTRELSPQITPLNLTFNLSRSLARRRFDMDLGKVSRVMKSRDRTFDAQGIASDLLDAFLHAGGELKIRQCVERIEKGLVHTAGESFRCRHVIVAAGRRTTELTGVYVRVVKSPILVIKPALTDVNFIRMTPNIEDSFNHLCHPSPAGDYSVIGNALFYRGDEVVDERALKAELLADASRVFGRAIRDEQAQLYFGYKAEAADPGSLRNYQYQILDGRQCVVVLPGKMSLAFSLAVNTCRHFGIDPVTGITGLVNPSRCELVATPAHFSCFDALP